MEKILKILIGIAAAFILFFWISYSFKSCGKERDAKTEQVAKMTEEEEFEEDLFEEGNAEEEVKVATPENDVVEEIVDDLIVVPEEKAEPVVVPKRSTPPPAPKKPKVVSTSGKYMVLSGSYLVAQNATKMKNRLSSQGYNAEVVQFDYSQYHTVVALRTNSYNEAMRVSRSLKSKGVDNYIHTKN